MAPGSLSAKAASLGHITPMVTTDIFVLRAITAFLVPVALSAICYLLVSLVAQLTSNAPREYYFRRLILLFVALVIWWVFYLPLSATAFIGNWADPHNAERYALWTAKQLGVGYGIHSIWAWVIVALVDRPKMRLRNPLQPSAATSGS